MARLQGGYEADGKPVAEVFDPVWVTVVATPDECARIGPMLPSGQVVPQDDDLTSEGFGPGWLMGDRQFYLEPADKRDVRHIAKAVEIETDDARLIDWMARG